MKKNFSRMYFTDCINIFIPFYPSQIYSEFFKISDNTLNLLYNVHSHFHKLIYFILQINDMYCVFERIINDRYFKLILKKESKSNIYKTYI